MEEDENQANLLKQKQFEDPNLTRLRLQKEKQQQQIQQQLAMQNIADLKNLDSSV